MSKAFSVDLHERVVAAALSGALHPVVVERFGISAQPNNTSCNSCGTLNSNALTYMNFIAHMWQDK